MIDPMVSEAAAIADIHLQIQPGTDTALVLGMLNVIIKEGLYDKEFVDKWCYGFEQLSKRVEDYPPEKVSQITGAPAEKIKEASRMYAGNKPGIVQSTPSTEQIPNSSQFILARFLLPAITGNYDVPGGQYLMESHPTMGLVADVECSEYLAPEQKAKLIGTKEFPLFSSWANYLKIEKNLMKVRNRPMAKSWWNAGMAHAPMLWRAVLTGKPYPIKAMITESSNPLTAFPNTRLVYEALMKLDLHVVVDIWMTPSALMADYVLPANSYLEGPFITPGAGDYMNFFIVGEAAISPMYERRDEYNIYRDLGLRLGQEGFWPWETHEQAYEHRLLQMGLTFKQAVEQVFIFAPRNYRKHEKAGFGTPTGKIELYNTTLEKLGFDPLPSWKEWPNSPNSDLAREFPMTLTSRRVREYSHSLNRQLKTVRERYPDPIARLNPLKAAELGIDDGDWLWIETRLGRVQFKCKHFDGLLPNVVSAEFGWWFPEDPAESPSLSGLWKSNLNVILDDDPDLSDPLTGAWPMRAVPCKVYKVTDQEVEKLTYDGLARSPSTGRGRVSPGLG